MRPPIKDMSKTTTELEIEIAELLAALKSLILAGSNESEKIAIHWAKKLIEKHSKP